MATHMEESDMELDALRTVAGANRLMAHTLEAESRIGEMLTTTADELDALRIRREQSVALIEHLPDQS